MWAKCCFKITAIDLISYDWNKLKNQIEKSVPYVISSCNIWLVFQLNRNVVLIFWGGNSWQPRGLWFSIQNCIFLIICNGLDLSLPPLSISNIILISYNNWKCKIFCHLNRHSHTQWHKNQLKIFRIFSPHFPSFIFSWFNSKMSLNRGFICSLQVKSWIYFDEYMMIKDQMMS